MNVHNAKLHSVTSNALHTLMSEGESKYIARFVGIIARGRNNAIEYFIASEITECGTELIADS
jgi:hypothetical protein